MRLEDVIKVTEEHNDIESMVEDFMFECCYTREEAEQAVVNVLNTENEI